MAITASRPVAWSNALLFNGLLEFTDMTRLRHLLVFSMATLLASGVALGSEIYKWTDDEGNVHYVDRPTGQPDETRLDIYSSRTDNAAVQARVQARREARATAEQVASEAPPEMTKEEIRAEQAERQQKCEMYRARLEQYLRSQRLYKEDDAGERVYLDEEQTLAARDRVQEQIKEYCGS